MVSVLVVALYYVNKEGWTYLEAVYFCVITIAGVGYGDYLPNGGARFENIVFFVKMKSYCYCNKCVNFDSIKFLILYRLFTSFYIIVGDVLLIIAVGKIITTAVELKIYQKKMAFLGRELDFDMIRELDTDGDGVDKFEFIFAVLIQIG
jgi:hypothetical protein